MQSLDQCRRLIASVRGPLRSLAALLVATSFLLLAAAGRAQPPPASDPPPDLTDLPLEELMNVRVTSVSKRSETVSEAAAAVYVLTQEDLRRAGVTSIPEALRLVPGLQVARGTANTWAISARGFNGRFANKLLVLVDGRSVYTPLFSGVFWDVQDTLLEDIERIEVIRGPGATLWGANAVNGVVNIITKSAHQTRGGLLGAAVGSEIARLGGARYGAGSGRASWRVYGKTFDRGPGARSDGGGADDDWSLTRGGFRLDAVIGRGDELTVQGDLYDGETGERLTFDALPGAAPRLGLYDNELSGGNLLARWSRTSAGGSHFTLQAYYDRTERVLPTILGETRDTYDLDFQQAVAWGRHELVWGLGVRRTRDRLDGSELITFEPEGRTDDLYGGFVQDEIAIVPERFWLTAGAKIEENDYTGFEVQPSVRALWIPRKGHAVWTAVSRAVRTPSRAEADVRLVGDTLPPGALFPGAPPAVVVFVGDPGFESEELLAFEAGYRAGLSAGLFLDLAAFYNDYDGLRSSSSGEPRLVLSPAPHVVVPTVIDNRMEGETWGLEVAAQWWPSDRWRLVAAYTFLEMDLRVSSGPPTAPGPEVIEGENPEQQLSLRSSWDLTDALALDVIGRWVDALPSQGVSDYLEADLRLGWRIRPGLAVALVGRNLLDEQHREFVPEIIPIQPTAVERSVHATVTWSF